MNHPWVSKPSQRQGKITLSKESRPLKNAGVITGGFKGVSGSWMSITVQDPPIKWD